MAVAYGAYGIVTKDGVTRTPFLIEGVAVQEFGGTTEVAVTDGATQPDLQIHAEIVVGLTEPGGTGTGNGFRVYLAPFPAGKLLTDLQVRVVILNPLNSAGVTAQVQPGQSDPYHDFDFYVLEYQTTGATPMAPLVLFQLAQLTKMTTKVSSASDIRLDDEIAIEACEPHGLAPLILHGGTATADTITFPGKRVVSSSPYAEQDVTIRGLDLARVLPDPAPSATSPASATWFELAAAVPAGVSGAQTHLKATIRTPHAGAAPSAPTAAPTTTIGPLPPGAYDYAISFVHPGGNETPLSGPSATVTLNAQGTIDVSGIDTGPSNPSDATETVVARRIYRRGPGSTSGPAPGGDQLLVAELPGPAAPSPPNPLPTTFTDAGDPIDAGGGQQLASGEFRYPSRLSVRYTADTALDLDGTLVLAAAGSGSTGVDRYQATVQSAPTEVLVVNDDRAALLPSLQPVMPPRTRLQWSASAAVDHLILSVPGVVTPFGAGVKVGVDGVPTAFGIDWRFVGELLTALDVRGELTSETIPDPAPAVGTGGPEPIERVWVILGTGGPAMAWPAGEATVGVETRQNDHDGYAAVAMRGLRWVLLTKGDGLPPPDHPDRLSGTLLLGPDPDQPAGGERTLRISSVTTPTAPGATTLSVWGRAGVLPDRLFIDYFAFATGDARGRASEATLIGALERVLGRFTRGVVGGDPADALEVWGSVVRTGDPSAAPASLAKLYLDQQNVRLALPEAWQVEAAVGGVPIPMSGATGATIHAQLRLPAAANVGFPANEYIATPAPDGLWGRAALTCAGNPVATRANPQIRIRNRPEGIPSFEGATARLLGLSDARLTLVPSTRDPNTGDFTDPVSKLIPSLSLAGPRPNKSLRFEGEEIDPRFQPGPRTPWKARIGSMPDTISGEIHSDEEAGTVFFVKTATSDSISDAVVWGEPLAIRDPGSSRPVVAGVQNVSALIGELPTSAEIVMIADVPSLHAGDPQYAGGETVPRVHAPSPPFQAGGVRLRLGGPLSVSEVRVAMFEDDDFVCLDKSADQTGFRSKWQEIIVPLLNVNIDGTPTKPDDTTVWLWPYTLVAPSPPPSGPPPDPCTTTAPKGPAHGYAFRIGDHLLVDAALRLYELHDLSTHVFDRWNTFTPGTDVDGATVGTWLFQDDLQMKGYRGEITITTADADKFDIPFGDWEAGPGNWYVRARDALSLYLYTGDAFLGNTGGGFQIPHTNGVFNARDAIFNITWPS
jgi:hypothetical protein